MAIYTGQDKQTNFHTDVPTDTQTCQEVCKVVMMKVI